MAGLESNRRSGAVVKHTFAVGLAWSGFKVGLDCFEE